MKRRDFLKLSGTVCLLTPFSSCARPVIDLDPDIKITRIVGFALYSKRNKTAGKNAVKGVHGSSCRDLMIRIYTNAGVDGIGHCRTDANAARQMVGRSLSEIYDARRNRMSGTLGAGTMALWDVAGKIAGKPVFELLGGKGGEKVGVYDGSIYFADLLPQYMDDWRDRFRQEIDMAMALGHRAFKVKIGRGHKWMPPEEGYARDKHVLEVIREHAGPEVVVGVDSNNGYTLDKAKQLLLDMPDYEFAFMEEMFPETVEQCLEFKDFIKSHGFKTLVADGESGREVEFYEPFVNARAVDICQADMRQFGMDGIMAIAESCRDKGILIAPHNWGSLIGYYMQLQIGRAIGNFYRAEQDPVSTDVIVADGYTIENGYATVPDMPGFGLEVDEDKFASKVHVRFDLKA